MEQKIRGRTSRDAPTGHKLFNFTSISLQSRRWAHIKRSLQYMENPIPIYAGFWRRLIAMIVDWAVLWVPCSLFGWLVDESRWDVWTFVATSFAQCLIIWTVYYGLLESSRYQATVGKFVMGLKVTDMAGRRISLLRASGRYLSQMASGLLLGIGFFMIGWTERKQGLHDIICGCLVVMKSQEANKA